MGRQVLFLLPGLLCDRAIWAPQIKALRAAGVTVEVADFRGFDSITAMAEAVLSAAPERFALAGHSMGARVSIEVMRLAPSRVERLALLDTGIHPRQPGEAERRQALVDLANTKGMRALAAQWLPPMVHPVHHDNPELMSVLTAMVERMSPEIFERQVRALLNRPEAAGVLGGIRCPVLVGVGRQDAWSPVSQHEAIVAAIPQAGLVIFEDSGHMAPLEAPAAVTTTLARWLGVR
ncbi:alpha/beta fold hydrolase [Bradyrhizobium sp. WD16]|uniref:alpha/beta fold hydrolase n=1 Tax=Bradyrhizobium sp. WD16 TaxID=1521768 RepID=UPI0020A37A38|nr:alpha/beta hydrolase [Bradyrhizobium sp. WD16]UTD28198.1 alpha/beta hydrolase [Bradyrhizobium sp. WD16]